jgi:hypothetical protein
MVRELSLAGPPMVTEKSAVLSSARSAPRSCTAPAMEREREATARLAIWRPRKSSQDDHLTAGRPCGDEASGAGSGDDR